MDTFDVLVVGAGFAGSVCARRMAEEHGLHVLVVDRRRHIGGNAFDSLDEHGVLRHSYGPHIFHTNSSRVSDFLSRFTEWRVYEHRVVAEVDGRFVPIPINRTTVQALHAVDLADEEATSAHLNSLAEPRAELRNSEDAVVAKVGRDLYERLFRGYTRKQWALDPGELHASVCARIPVRTDNDDRYFTDEFQKMPADGYTAMFERMLDHPNIEVRTGTAYDDVRDDVSACQLVWTGPIDAFFGHRFGRLPYRSLRFEYETRATPGARLAQPVGTVNYPNERIPYTRVTEFRHLTGQLADVSTLAYEFPVAEGDPYYPIPRPQNRELYRAYEALAKGRSDVLFVGRLARYQYLNMDQVVGAALVAVDRWAAARADQPLAVAVAA
ncbi:MAG TPA: UDP-galactopyranose mutase [Solirubrobacteraceae bacterium]|jgi:UDP-galactopyranose mutase|nr:UDP-galactopyranose mutase [Solirubrobacteraceae bacterium]